MQGKVNYTVVGIFVVVLTAFLFAGIMWMSAFDRGIKYDTYWVFVQEDVTGLNVESPVRFNGVKVGFIKSIHLDPNNSRVVKLILNVEPNIPISTSTYATLNAQGITGVVYLNLKSETETAPRLVATPGEPVPIIPARLSVLMQLSEVLPQVAKNVRELSANVAKVLDEQNRASVKESLQNMALVTKTLADNSEDFTQSMGALKNALGHISEASAHLPGAVKQLGKTLTSVDQLVATMKKTSGAVSITMNTGEHAIRNFSTQVMPNAQQALSNLTAATNSVHQLADELERNPSMLLRGKQPAEPGPGEKQ